MKKLNVYHLQYHLKSILFLNNEFGVIEGGIIVKQ